MSSPIKVGFVGLSKTGWAANTIAPALLKHPDKYSIVAVSTRSPESARSTAEKYSGETGKPITPYHGETSKIAQDHNVELVIVSVKTPDHLAAVLPAIEAGKDVFLEWPVGANLKETSQLVEAARRKGIRTIAGLQTRHSPVIRKVKEIIDSGKIGRVLSSNLNSLGAQEMFSWGPKTKEANVYLLEKNPEGNAPVLDIFLGHSLDAVTYVLGPYASVSATGTIHFSTSEIVDDSVKPTGKTIKPASPDHVAFTGLLKSGAISSQILRGGQPSTPGRTQFLWEIDGETGSIRIENDAPLIGIIDSRAYLNGERIEISSQEGTAENVASALVEYAKGEKGNYVTFEDALEVRKLVDAVTRSQQEGRAIKL